MLCMLGEFDLIGSIEIKYNWLLMTFWYGMGPYIYENAQLCFLDSGLGRLQ